MILDNMQWFDGKVLLALWVVGAVAIMVFVHRASKHGAPCEHFDIVLLHRSEDFDGITVAPASCIDCRTHLHAVLAKTDGDVELIEVQEAPDCGDLRVVPE